MKRTSISVGNVLCFRRGIRLSSPDNMKHPSKMRFFFKANLKTILY